MNVLALGQVFYNAAYAMVGTQATAAIEWLLLCKICHSFSSEELVVAIVGNRVDVTKSNKAQKEAKRFVTISLSLEVTGIQSLTLH